MQRLLRLLRSEDGPTAVEYAVMLALIVGTALGTIHFLAQQTGACFDRTCDEIETAVNNGS
ncbi:MAG TPA: Flp family type IVb pilin [Pirellulaceae bacterium]|nr:Flp family type IVb pilin [Pirellulaceae bacterium]